MINRVGYACINEHLKPLTFRSCRLNSVLTKGTDFLRDIIIHNINHTKKIIEWNLEHSIFMYRVPSDLVPLATHPEILKKYTWRWYMDKDILKLLSEIKTLTSKNKIRLSMHPDQFTVINSNQIKVVKSSIENLEYHTLLLSALGGNDIIIHVGGVYGDKVSAIKRFIHEYNQLDPSIKKFLRIENDDKSYSIFDVLEISNATHIPIVFDYHHHRCLNNVPVTLATIERINKTWNNKIPKIHISSGKNSITDRRHSDFISTEDCLKISDLYQDFKVDLMIEAKKKDFAALQVMQELKNIYSIKGASYENKAPNFN